MILRKQLRPYYIAPSSLVNIMHSGTSWQNFSLFGCFGIFAVSWQLGISLLVLEQRPALQVVTVAVLRRPTSPLAFGGGGRLRGRHLSAGRPRGRGHHGPVGLCPLHLRLEEDDEDGDENHLKIKLNL